MLQHSYFAIEWTSSAALVDLIISRLVGSGGAGIPGLARTGGEKGYTFLLGANTYRPGPGP